MSMAPKKLINAKASVCGLHVYKSVCMLLLIIPEIPTERKAVLKCEK